MVCAQRTRNFNAEIKTDFDPTLSSVEGKINVVPQDIGRVLLNLYNNAFYAVSDKSKNPEGFENPRGLQKDLTGSSNLSALPPYVPQVTIVTKKLNDKILISVSDNGPGIPQNIVDKIFQPFFTTKPTGQGTGLGLSLSYDIIKAHGGDIKVETKKGEGLPGDLSDEASAQSEASSNAIGFDRRLSAETGTKFMIWLLLA
jgi:signal transduction histidine kinase